MVRERPIGIMAFEKIAIFIDGWNLAKTSKEYLNKEIDFKKLLDYFSREAYVLRAFYYIGEVQDPEERKRQQSFLTWLKRNGYKVITRPIKTFVDQNGERKEKADLDVDIAIDMFDLADKVDKVVLFSGDGDFTRLIERIGMKGVKTMVVSHWGRGKGPIDPKLMEAADEFLDLEEIIDEIAKIK